ncbi:putative ENT domain, protein EMSY-LIKE, plant [Lupinus albus]|uniref:Putative ENT domain, protein EMSY-LIKE, plant n=1 Tax=Lupinus albus TaxID=3870 RepID=A0A6A4P2U0_LUPAL|nr:putative ENT domain, protein EMSY-LIKE, plant [Lupinus albus]
MASLIRQAERDAYSTVLRAFKYQTEDLSWEKQELMIDLRKELRISDDEHKQLLCASSTDENLNSIRNWRRISSHQPASCSTSQPVHDVLPSPTDLTQRKRRWTSNQPLPNLPSVKSVQNSSAGPAREHHVRDCNLYSSLPSKAPVQAEALDQLIGRKAMIRWPSDEKFYEVTITEYDPSQGMHMLVYDDNEETETYEWADISKVLPCLDTFGKAVTN